MTLISCIFCQCQMPASASMAKYEEHLQGWHNITVAEELKRAVQIASGFQGTVNTVKGTVNTVEGTSDAVYGTVTTGPPLHPSSPESMLDSSKTAHTSEPACLEQLSMSPAFSLNSSHSQSNSLSKVKLEPGDDFGAEIGTKSMQEATHCQLHFGQLKTESGDNELAGLQNVDTQDEKSPSHLHVPRSRDKVKCDECGLYLSKNCLLNHKRIVHRGEKPFCCKIDDCNERFHLAAKLGDHKRKEHNYPKLKCKAEGCESEFSLFNEYKRHQDTHQIMIECEECGKRLSQRYLREHKKLVHQTPVVECEMADCGKKFSCKSHLADHMRMVHGFAKLKCNVGECTAEFMSDAVLMKHKKGHFK